MKVNLSRLLEDHGVVPKDAMRRIIRRMGIEVFTLKNLPYGINHLVDAVRERDLYPKTIFDVGANLGQTSVYLRKAFNDSEIYAFEPVGSTFTKLEQNVSDKRIRTFNFGLGERKQTAEVFLQKSNTLNSLVESLNKPNGLAVSEIVEINTIDNFCIDNQIATISLLKIDTEGFGINVLKGADTMLKERRIESIFIEVGFNERDQRHDLFCEVNSVLSSYSFKLFGFYNQWIENSHLEYCNAFFTLSK